MGVLTATGAADVIPHNLCWCMAEGLGEILEKPSPVLDNSNSRSSFSSKVPKDPQNTTCLQNSFSMNVPLSHSDPPKTSHMGRVQMTPRTWDTKKHGQEKPMSYIISGFFS